MSKKILTGSRAFFTGLEGFEPKDTDYVRLLDKGNGFDYVRQIRTGSECIFEWVRRPKAELIAYALEHGPAMQVVKFLTPEFAEEIGLTVKDISKLRPLIDRLDPKHTYVRTIYEAYIANKAFTLTDEQRAEAFEVYKAARPAKKTARHDS